MNQASIIILNFSSFMPNHRNNYNKTNYFKKWRMNPGVSQPEEEAALSSGGSDGSRENKLAAVVFSCP